MTAPGPNSSPTATAGLFAELQDLKRLAPAGVRYSLSDELFVGAWDDLLSGTAWDTVADRSSVRAVLYVLFPGVGAEFFRAAGLSATAVTEVCTGAFERTLSGRVPSATYRRLATQLPTILEEFAGGGAREPAKFRKPTRPPCLQKLREQPRAGATHPDHPRLVLMPPESHADHCLLTAVYACLVADDYGAAPGEAFVCGLAHHLHNAFLPDCGWAGELALEPYLEQVIANCRSAALREFDPVLRDRLTDVLRHHESIATPVGKAISTGDVLDRVLDVKWRVRAASVSEQKVLGELDLVHPGPLKDFQTDLLTKTGLWTTH
ncbi:hypothetical protein [Lewinella sp. JB7]|uniref:hypothetical protein n=1 Tax=Lewinella sp. JB7 TaxID=2962887 RepID=UPI0020C93BCE|nr:hypothetical protein [Lewinella sp. JB7]MCP9236936.1 hypothetical protein [Lewinella sp. JB7]